MPTKQHSTEVLQQTVNLYAQFGNATECAAILGIPVSTFTSRLNAAKTKKILPAVEHTKDIEKQLRTEIKLLKAALQTSESQKLTFENVKKHILDVFDHEPDPPDWLTPKFPQHSVTGVPTIFLSDWHWGEVVKPAEIDGVNEFNLKIAHQRAKLLWSHAERLLFNYINNPKYDGVVVVLGGDMLSGDIHEELVNTNERRTAPTAFDLIDVLTWLFDNILERFNKVYVPCVTGNHGRMTRKPVYKERGPTSWDWVVYQCLKRHYAKDKRITFEIPDGPDILYKIYNHRYLLSHGDQFKGGSGIAGPLMTIERGRHKKSTRNIAINRPFDTMILGHWHTLIQLQHLVVNGTLKGYDELAWAENYTFERPSQAMWITHPYNGITHQMPIYLDSPKKDQVIPWVSVTGV